MTVCHQGSFYCGECKPGWVGWADDSFPYGCRAANFCASATDNDCNENAYCIYIGPGQYKCEVRAFILCFHHVLTLYMVNVNTFCCT